MNISEAQNRAAGEFVDLIASAVGSGRAIHPETAISSAGRIAGSLLLRSFGLRIESIESGTPLLSEEANEKGPVLFGLTSAFLTSSGVSLDKSLLSGDRVNRGTEPKLSVLQALSLLQEDAIQIATRNGLSLEEAAQSAALATAFIVKECAGSIGAEVGFNVAVFSFIEGSKTVPPAITQHDASASKKRPWFKVW